MFLLLMISEKKEREFFSNIQKTINNRNMTPTNPCLIVTDDWLVFPFIPEISSSLINR